MTPDLALPRDVQAGLLGILREAVGPRVALAETQVLKQDVDYFVIRARLAHPSWAVVVKLAGPGAARICPFERTAALHRLVAARTSIPMPEVLAADVSYRQWPWRYLVRTAVPGVAWATVRESLSKEELAGAHAQIGRAVAELHQIRFPAFGELDAGSSVAAGRPYLAALAAHARSRIADRGQAGLFVALLAEHAALFAAAGPPCLCHEDLHPYNLLFQQEQGRWRLATILDFDKAWAGHAESDLARLDLWRGLAGAGFWPAYRAIAPVDPAYLARRPLYQLLWCLEYGATTPQHLADTRRVCRALRIPCPLPG